LAGVGVAMAALAVVPAAAQGHVSVHPNVLPAGGFVTVNVRVPTEMDNATTTKVQTQLPEGFTSVSAQVPPGWSVAYRTQRLARPIQSDDGPITSEVREIDWTATGRGIPVGQFMQFPISVSVPGRAGDVLRFPTVQTYSNGRVVRWIGPTSDANPAPTIDVSAANGPLLDVAGGEAGPTAGEVPGGEGGAAASAGAGEESEAMQMQMAGEEPAASESSGGSGSDNTLAIVALIVGALGLAIGVASVVIGRKGAAS